MFMATMAETEMTSLQGKESNREQGILLDRENRAPFNGMRGKRDPGDNFYSRVSFVMIGYS